MRPGATGRVVLYKGMHAWHLWCCLLKDATIVFALNMRLLALQALSDDKEHLTWRLLELVRHLLWQQRCTLELATHSSSPCIGPPGRPSLSAWPVFAPTHLTKYCPSSPCTLKFRACEMDANGSALMFVCHGGRSSNKTRAQALVHWHSVQTRASLQVCTYTFQKQHNTLNNNEQAALNLSLSLTHACVHV